VAAAPQQSATPTPAPTAVVDVPVTSSSPKPAPRPVEPVRLEIGSIGADLAVRPVGVDRKGQMELPRNPAVAGWYRYGPDAAADEGRIVLAAHVDAPGFPIGPLAGLRDLSEDAKITLVDEKGVAREFRVGSVKFYTKSKLPVDKIFARDGKPALVITTCGGPFDYETGHYRDNVVAIAWPA
jgi:hypothetical protein